MDSDGLIEIAARLLKNKEVDVIIGYKNGNLPYTTRPAFIKAPEETDELIFNRFSRINLAGYIKEFRGKKVGIFAKGCDARSINMLVVEKQIDRKSVYIIGLPCPMMLDNSRLKEVFPYPKEIDISDGRIVLRDENRTVELEFNEYVDKTCARCNHRNPVIYDILLGEPVVEKEKDYDKLLGGFLNMDPEKRWELFERELVKCIRCYGCRQICPTCYCDECFVDCNKPKWLDKGVEKSDILFWHIGRIYHQAGRCVDCGSCSFVCPVGIDFSPYLLYMEYVVKNNFNYEPGIKIDEPPPLQTFKKDDPQEFIL